MNAGRARGVPLPSRTSTDSLDLHVGQCLSVLVTADQAPKDYYLVVSSRFAKHALTTVGVVRYQGSNGVASTELPPPPPANEAKSIAWSINQFRSFRWKPDRQRRPPQPPGLVPLRPDQHHPHHQDRQLPRAGRREAQVRDQRRVPRGRRDPTQAGRVLRGGRQALPVRHRQGRARSQRRARTRGGPQRGERNIQELCGDHIREQGEDRVPQHVGGRDDHT
ncbi:l-ascorbate oxidase homolog [Phtheirospermum japonicum]|uniref:L-ascorbate oxidase homolog n=1 Tax=Phtheirospermum japonicum TaxID=374723 RepID=A0A830C8R3_9LAMI|nr:l-ascorbate oxidase homolog [Phtheirospermum japonicum]